MLPVIPLNFLAIGVSVLATMVIGFLWYGPIFGKIWVKEMGLENMEPNTKQMMKSMALGIVGAFLTAYVLSHSIFVWKPSSWHLEGDGPAWKYGAYGAFYVWLGFFVPLLFNSIAWEGKSWRLFFVNASHNLVSLMVTGIILAVWPG
ncbi:DUF1761 domain-containing protein [Leptospira wolffii]|uniref:Uncharacterized protein n=1 Tax=Leptospira wolffii TaxID=409998 RepID=A0A2M9ZG89_9LEPT|nr:DUF1761 domain-containing protein [Leptospira wolffii]PJZ67450.1 hypothetical protein CH371_05370 [Leptospira wolffii]TGK62455.1 DUF1761 domain-containing protein [Leptospira wolffii]TGK65998.1 DUF1761 domain-containing protein [Leptospira wolffii]TGK74160.1 DUF1761 domain-containing protein [Leptospira wolffii]TGL29019.1 DUF1761 domain-containing protein [Leptospira wolffii]